MVTSSRTAMMLLLACSLQAAPLHAQTTLTGSIAKTETVKTQPVKLYSQQASYDHRPQVIYRKTPPRTVVRTVYLKDQRTYWQRHPKVKAAAIGAGVGTAAGAVTGLVTGRGVVRGAAIGAGTGAGVGLIRSSRTMKRHPIVRDVATGAVTGLGLGWAGSRRGKTAAKAAGVGAAIGLGVGVFKNLR